MITRNISQLPFELLVEIFFHMEPEEAQRCSVVCHVFRSAIAVANSARLRYGTRLRQEVGGLIFSRLENAPRAFSPIRHSTKESLLQLAEEIGSSVWLTDHCALYWVSRDEKNIPSLFWFHTQGDYADSLYIAVIPLEGKTQWIRGTPGSPWDHLTQYLSK